MPHLCLDVLKLDREAVIDYEDKLKVKVWLSINKEGKMLLSHSWKCKSNYVLGENEDKCYYFLHPELVRDQKDKEG